MKNRMVIKSVLLVLSTMLFVLPVFAGNYRSKKPDVEQRCDEARELELAPERERLIEKCVATKKDVAYCESYYRDYGAGGRGAGGKYRKRLYNNLPECQAAKKNAQRNRDATEEITLGRDATDFTTRDTVLDSNRHDLDDDSAGRDGDEPSSR